MKTSCIAIASLALVDVSAIAINNTEVTLKSNNTAVMKKVTGGRRLSFFCNEKGAGPPRLNDLVEFDLNGEYHEMMVDVS